MIFLTFVSQGKHITGILQVKAKKTLLTQYTNQPVKQICKELNTFSINTLRSIRGREWNEEATLKPN